MVGPVIFDAIKRYLAYSGYEVTLVVNITDVDDKLIAEANAPRHADGATGRRDDGRLHAATSQALGVDAIDHFPRAPRTSTRSSSSPQTLIEKGFAYEADGDVYFDVAKDPDYGKLSHRGVEAMQGEGGGMAERKRSARRLRPVESGQAGRAVVGQPLGPGPARLAHRVLGHEPQAAGRDVRHPRRRARPGLPASRKRDRPERMLPRQADGQVLDAQRPDAGLGARWARSAGAAPGPPKAIWPPRRPARSASRRARPRSASCSSSSPAETIRFFLLSTHYRRPIDFSEERIREVETGMDTFYRFFKRFERVAGESFYDARTPRRRGQQGDFEPGDESAA